MFVGEFLCVLGLAWTSYSKSKKLSSTQPQVSIFTRIMARLPVGTVTPSYHPVGQDDDSSEVEDEVPEELGVKLDEDNALTGWRMLLMWFPAFFDSMCSIVVLVPAMANTRSLRYDPHERRAHLHSGIDLPNVKRESRTLRRGTIGCVPPTATVSVPMGITAYRHHGRVSSRTVRKSRQESARRWPRRHAG